MSKGKKEKITNSLKFVLILIGLGLVYSFDAGTINTVSASENKIVKTEINNSVDHASLYFADATFETQTENETTNNRSNLLTFVLASAGLLIVSLFIAEVGTRIT